MYIQVTCISRVTDLMGHQVPDLLVVRNHTLLTVSVGVGSEAPVHGELFINRACRICLRNLAHYIKRISSFSTSIVSNSAWLLLRSVDDLETVLVAAGSASSAALLRFLVVTARIAEKGLKLGFWRYREIHICLSDH